jgi:Domain of unknown function (DUF4129)
MDANAPRPGGSGRRTLAVAVAVIALVAVVAIASGGSAPSGSVGAHRPSNGLLDAVVSLAVVGTAAAGVLVAVMVPLFGRHAPEGRMRKRPGPVQSLVTFVVSVALLVIVVRVLAGSAGPRLRPAAPPPGGAGSTGADSSSARYEPHFALWPVLAVLALAAAAVVAWWLAARGRREARGPLRAAPHEALADVLAETLDDLRAERDPRKAVIAAYSRMERALAASGLPREPSEAPEEFLGRVLAEVAVSRSAATRLTSLFTWARFSGHDVRPEMKDEAIDTLEQVQRELVAADAALRLESSGTAA